MGQVLVMAHAGTSTGRPVLESDAQRTVVQGRFGDERSVRAEQRRLAAQERAQAQARRVARASVDGSLSDLELTRRGRWVLWSTAIAVAMGVAVMGGGALASTPEVPREVVLHTVSEGDNLWGLAEGIAAPGEDLRDVVDQIIAINGRSTASLWAGEQIMLPVRG